jgi:Tol biopolymer transport system component
VGALAWSPDSRTLVFHARLEGQADVFSIPATGGAWKRLTTHPSDDLTPSYSHDGRSIYFSSSRSGTGQIWKMPAAGGEAVQVASAQGGYMPMESPDGKTLYFCHSLPEKGIWKIPVQGGQAVQVIGSYKPTHWSLAVTGEGLYYTTARPRGRQHSIEFFSFSTGKTRPVVVSDGPIGGLALSVSRDQRYILFTQSDQPGSDLMVIENFMVQ